MKILFIAGASVFTNYSTNFFKRTLIKALNESGNDVTVIQTNKDSTFQLYNEYIHEGVRYIEYKSGSLKKSFWIRFKKLFPKKRFIVKTKKSKVSDTWKMDYGKKYINTTLEHFSGEFDVVISVSNPVTSHRLAFELIKQNKIKCSKWYQVWFEYWYNDPRIPEKDEQLIHEEGRLLKESDAIFYSNHLLLKNQSELFPQVAHKMRYFDFPYPIVQSTLKINNSFTIGYFGTYHSKVRNIKPFYNSIIKLNLNTHIIGQSDVLLEEKNNITIINDKIPANECAKLEDSMDLLIVLCNWHNDLVPGKLYMYAMTIKPILVILDGPQHGKEFIKTYFGKYDRFYFCENNEKDIEGILKVIQKEYQDRRYHPVVDFLPESVVSNILSGLDSIKQI